MNIPGQTLPYAGPRQQPATGPVTAVLGFLQGSCTSARLLSK